MWAQFKHWAKEIESEGLTLWFCCRDPAMPWLPKLLALLVVGYFLSPIDLIPDFIPVLGYLDDIIIVPLGILLVVRLIPPEVMQEHREAAMAASHRPISRAAAAVVIAIWIASAAGVCILLMAR